MIKRLEKWILCIQTLRSYMASLTNTQGNTMDGISGTVSFSVRFTNRFFCSPHTWNNETRLVEMGESKWNWRNKVWKISTMICLVVTFTQILMEIRYTFLCHEGPTTIILFRRLQILVSSAGIISQLVTIYKVKEYQEFMNQYLRLFRLVEQDYILTPSTFKRIFWMTRILTILFVLIILYLPFAFVIVIAYPEVDPNVFSKLLPGVFTRTSVAGRREHWNPFVAFAIGGIEYTVLSQQCLHFLNYLSLVSIGSISILQLFQEMRNVIVRSQDNLNSPLLDLTYFIKLYKASYLLCNRLNDWIAAIVVPGGLSISLVMIVSLNYTLLTGTTNGFQKFTLVAVEFVTLICSGVCLHMFSFLSFRSKESLRGMAVRRVVLESNYDSRRLRGCMDCRSYCGSLFYFSRTSVLVCGLYIVDYTIQAVLTFP